MANVGLNIHCGCGFKAKRLEEAVEHSDTAHHTIDISGIIKPTVNKAMSKIASKASPVEPQKQEKLADDSVLAIRNLRAKFGRK